MSSIRTLPGSFSSRNGAAQSKTQKDKRTRLEPDTNKADGQFGNVTPVSESALRRAIDSCTCPWCGKGPFRMLPVHTAKAHGVDKWQFREMAGLSTTDPLCSSEVRLAMSEHAKANPGQHLATAASRGRGNRKPQRWTRAGRARTAQNLAEWEIAHPVEALEQRRIAAEKAKSPDAMAARSVSLRRRHEMEPQLRMQLAARMRTPEALAKAAVTRRKTLDSKLQPHGTVAAYKRGCRCEVCKSAKRTYRRYLATK